MNHQDLDYRGRIPKDVRIEGARLYVPFTQEPAPDSTATGIAAAVDGPFANPKKWPEAVHVAFANLNLDDTADFASFVKTYGISGHFCNRDETGKIFVGSEYAKEAQRFLRLAWDQNYPGVQITGVAAESADPTSTDPGDFQVKVVNGTVRIVVADLQAFITLGYLIDLANKRVRVCEFPECKRQRYFLKVRSDQEYCSPQCRAQHNMKLWRADPKNAARELRKARKRLATSKKKRGTK
jgi:hypothetical protein